MTERQDRKKLKTVKKRRKRRKRAECAELTESDGMLRTEVPGRLGPPRDVEKREQKRRKSDEKTVRERQKGRPCSPKPPFLSVLDILDVSVFPSLYRQF